MFMENIFQYSQQLDNESLFMDDLTINTNFQDFEASQPTESHQPPTESQGPIGHQETTELENIESPSKSTTRGLKFLLDKKQAGSLLGPKGKTIQYITSTCLSNIFLSLPTDKYPGTERRVAYLSGSDEEILITQEYVWKALTFLMIRRRREDASDWDPSDMEVNFVIENFGGNVEGMITIPVSAAGLVIGKSGSTIQNIAKESNANVVVGSKQNSNLTSERIVYISGTYKSCVNATRLIILKLAEEPQISVYKVRGSKYKNFNNVSTFEQITTSNILPDSRKATSPRISNASSPSNTSEFTLEISVNNSKLGQIVGKNGQIMKEIVKLSGAFIAISPR